MSSPRQHITITFDVTSLTDWSDMNSSQVQAYFIELAEAYDEFSIVEMGEVTPHFDPEEIATMIRGTA